MDDGAPKRGRGRGRGARSRGRGRGRGRGRAKKAAKIIESDEEQELEQPNDPQEEQQVPQLELTIKSNENSATEIDLEADISQLEAPTFTTINRGPPEPMLRLDWTHKVNLIGEKVLNPMIHCCDKCLKPILIYGRMIPCKHVFCLACGKQEQKQCPRCLDKVSRVEQTGLGTVFMCSHGGSRYGSNGCRRTYLSQRDLQAHINHRHVSQTANIEAVEPAPPPPPPPSSSGMAGRGSKGGSDPRGSIAVSTNVRQRSSAPPQGSGSGMRTNLITVPIQDSGSCDLAPGQQQQQQPPPPPPPQQSYYGQYHQHQASAGGGGGGGYGHGQASLPPMHMPPPQQAQYYPSHSGYGGSHTNQGYQGYGNQAPPPPPPSAPYNQTQAVGAPNNRNAQQYDYSSAPPQQWTNNHFYR